ncbi:MAG: GAF domain-containing protein, partial [Chloroflexi bacterium]|nr:GAF domain-containing protein [Chloroflexota bacterium]
AIAIDNAELFEISQQRGADMAFLFDATSTAAVSGGLLEALETVATVLIRQLNGHETGIFLHDPEQDLLNAEVVVIAEPQDDGVAYRFVDTDESVPVGQGVIGNVAAAQDPMIIRDFKEERRFFPWLTHSRSGIYVPLALGERLIGVMGIEAARPGQYDNNDLRLLQTLSTSLSAIIQSAQLVEELQATNERLREIDQLKTNFLAAMSHELRTPLNSIIGFSRVILKGIDGPISDMQLQDIQTIHDSGKHLLGLVNDILDQAKIEAGKMELVKEYFDLAAVVKGVMSSAKGLTKDKPIQLYTEIQDDLPQAFGDEFRTRQILFNLVSNAAKFTHEGSITVSTFSTASSEDDRTMILVSVADTGIGIAQEDQESIFASFQQVDNSTTRSVEGTGLGLPLARSLAELQGGALWLESEVGTGSTFFVSVPIEPPPAEEGGGEDSAPVAVQSIQVSGRDTVELAPVTPRMMNDADKTLPVRPKRRTMLAVDNELEMINLYRRCLSKAGWEVIGETDPAKIDERVALHQPDLILLDINLPESDGW